MHPDQDALLLLADGYVTRGKLIGKPGTTSGKLVFNTSMTGYHEILTDPSYAGEMITFTFPLIGIYGVCPGDEQSDRIHARGVIVSDLSNAADNWRSDQTLNDTLLYEGKTGISGVDTRRLTRHLRLQGEMPGIITSELSESEARNALSSLPDFGAQDFVKEVTCSERYTVEPGGKPGGGKYTVAAWDFGIKRGIIECFNARDCTVHVFPATATADELRSVSPDGVFLSNGPGDPERMDYVLPHVQEMMEELPTFGICLGHQVMARAAGLPTYRLKFGNRGANHPVLDLASGRVNISSQNHSYAVRLEDGARGCPAAAEVDSPRAPLGDDRPTDAYPHPLNQDVLITHLNVNDSSNEGLRWRSKPAFSVQYHPEGCPGPRDNLYLFDEFVAMLGNVRSG